LLAATRRRRLCDQAIADQRASDLAELFVAKLKCA
jgi:hypothetical protein